MCRNFLGLAYSKSCFARQYTRSTRSNWISRIRFYCYIFTTSLYSVINDPIARKWTYRVVLKLSRKFCGYINSAVSCGYFPSIFYWYLRIQPLNQAITIFHVKRNISKLLFKIGTRIGSPNLMIDPRTQLENKKICCLSKIRGVPFLRRSDRTSTGFP